LVVTPERVTDDASLLEQLGADSLDLVNLAMQVETEFSIVIPEQDFEKLVRFNKAVDYILSKIETAGVVAVEASAEPKLAHAE